MKKKRKIIDDIINQVPEKDWKMELEKTTVKYHQVAAWAAIIFDPVFAITDYYNIPGDWLVIFYLRLIASAVTLLTVVVQRKLRFSSYVIVIVPFTLISFQNAITYAFVGNEDLLGHNLNYMALLIGAALFLAWETKYSIGALTLSAFATAYFLHANDQISIDLFFVNGGLLLIAVGVFMLALIKTRYRLTVKEIKARLALQITNEEIQRQNEEIQAQAEKIKGINDHLEQLVSERTRDLQRKNKALEEYAFINAHKLRSPLASILGLVNLASKLELTDDGASIIHHLKKSSEDLDGIVGSITKAIERAN